MILGHRPPAVEEALRRALEIGTVFGAPSRSEVELAERIRDAVPTVEMVRLVNSGTEATMSALRLARGVTGRNRFLKFDGCYHGHGDSFLVAAGSGAATLGVPSSPGVPEAVTADTLTAPFNDLAAVEGLFAEKGHEIAAVFVEPVAGNMGLVPPVEGFLEGLRRLCDEHGALLVFDEVMTGFRVSFGGAQELLEVEPDLTTLGKVIGGGLPIGAYGGSRDLMSEVAPAGPVYQAGTLSGNPLAVAAGRTTLEILADGEVYSGLETTAGRLADGLLEIAEEFEIPLTIQRRGSMLGIFFAEGPIRNKEEVDASDRERFARVFHRLLDQGVHPPPSAYETWFVSAAHGEEEIGRTLEAWRSALAKET